MTGTSTTRAAVKENAGPVVSLYERRKLRRIPSALFFVLLLVLFLLAMHFLNLFLQWTVIRLEIVHGPVFRSPEYSFLGFSLFNQKEIAAVRYFKNSSKPTRVFGFFDFIHPVIFAIWNKNEMNFLDLGPIVMAVRAGFSRVSFLPGSIFFVDHENTVAVKYFAASPAAELWHGFLAKKFSASSPAVRNQLAVSFVIKELEKSRYLKIPYLIYFYFPLLTIIFLAIHCGSFMLTAFFYYAEICFLIDYRKMFVTIPFDWLFKLLNWEISVGMIEVLAAFIITIFVICAVFGLWQWKKSNISSREKGIILFFILLPFFLFF